MLAPISSRWSSCVSRGVGERAADGRAERGEAAFDRTGERVDRVAHEPRQPGDGLAEPGDDLVVAVRGGVEQRRGAVGRPVGDELAQLVGPRRQSAGQRRHVAGDHRQPFGGGGRAVAGERLEAFGDPVEGVLQRREPRLHGQRLVLDGGADLADLAAYLGDCSEELLLDAGLARRLRGQRFDTDASARLEQSSRTPHSSGAAHRARREYRNRHP